MQKERYIPLVSIIEPETFASTPPSALGKNSQDPTSKRAVVIGSGSDGKPHNTTKFTADEIHEICGMLRNGQRVRVSATALDIREDSTDADKLVHATKCMRGSILFDPNPVEVRDKKMTVMAVLTGAALGLFLLAKLRVTGARS